MSPPLLPGVLLELRRLGVVPAAGEEPGALRERLNDLYIGEIRRLKGRLATRQVELADYPERVRELRDDFQLLGLPLARWVDRSG